MTEPSLKSMNMLDFWLGHSWLLLLTITNYQRMSQRCTDRARPWLNSHLLWCNAKCNNKMEWLPMLKTGHLLSWTLTMHQRQHQICLTVRSLRAMRMRSMLKPHRGWIYKAIKVCKRSQETPTKLHLTFCNSFNWVNFSWIIKTHHFSTQTKEVGISQTTPRRQWYHKGTMHTRVVSTHRLAPK